MATSRKTYMKSFFWYNIWYGTIDAGWDIRCQKIMSSFVGQKSRKENTDDVHRNKLTFAFTCPLWVNANCVTSAVTSLCHLVILSVEERLHMTRMFPTKYHILATCLSSIILHGTLSLFQVVIKVKIISTRDLTCIIYHSCNQHSWSYLFTWKSSKGESLCHMEVNHSLLMTCM